MILLIIQITNLIDIFVMFWISNVFCEENYVAAEIKLFF